MARACKTWALCRFADSRETIYGNEWGFNSQLGVKKQTEVEKGALSKSCLLHAHEHTRGKEAEDANGSRDLRVEYATIHSTVLRPCLGIVLEAGKRGGKGRASKHLDHWSKQTKRRIEKLDLDLISLRDHGKQHPGQTELWEPNCREG